LKQILFSILICTACCNSKQKDVPAAATLPFAATPVATPVSPGIIDEASGIADSRANPGCLWVEEDSGNPPDIYLLKYNGSLLKKIAIKGAQNRDWEDMAVSSGPAAGTSYIYLADIGDNNSSYKSCSILRFPEPDAAKDVVEDWDKINFIYPDGPHDAEAILVDDATKDIYVITKRDAQSKVYKLAYPQSLTEVNIAAFVTGLPYTGVVSAAFSKNGQEFIIKTYTSLFYYTRKSGESMDAALTKAATTLSYQLEPQGEAVCFKNDNTGFYTLSEKSFAPSVSLNFYKRL
jgi:hypothetical protein